MTNIFTKWFGKKEVESNHTHSPFKMKPMKHLGYGIYEEKKPRGRPKKKYYAAGPNTTTGSNMQIGTSLPYSTADQHGWSDDCTNENMLFNSVKEAKEAAKKRMSVPPKKPRGRSCNKPYHTLGDVPNPNEGTKKRRGRPHKLKPSMIREIESTQDIMQIPIPTSEFIMEAECKQFTKLTNKARKKLEDKEKFPRRLLIKAASRKFPFTYGHCYLGKAIEQWYENKHKKPVKPKIYKDPKPIYPKKNKHGGWE